jgi:hexosaminidase
LDTVMTRSERQVRCLPLPLRVYESGDRSHEESEPEIAWLGHADGRVQRYFDNQFARSRIGSITVAIGEVDSNPPQLGNDESYELVVGAAQIKLSANTTWGALRGLATLYQLEELQELDRVWHIADEPRFAWRGLLIDVARHFIPLATLREVIDGLAVLKMNTLHLHLSDDQGFRFESHTFPHLASADCYSKSQLRELVAYAADRGVRVVPELDVPGHVTSWLVGYPQWGFGGGEPSNKFGVHKACLDVTDEDVFAALQALFSELVEVFPEQYVHFGGDEVNPAHWQQASSVQTFMQAQSLASPQDLQNNFNGRLCTVIRSLGREPMGWDEILHRAMPRCAVQNWRGATTRDRARAEGVDTVVSAGFYLDLFYPSETHYAYDPELSQPKLVELENSMRTDVRFAHVAAGMAWTDQWREGQIELHAPDEAVLGRVLGGEACLFGELVDVDTLPIRLWSRLPAIAERLWTAADQCDVETLYRRMPDVLGFVEFRWASVQTRGFEQAGLKSELASLTVWFEPVKWYARLLGETALQARLQGSEMPQARPYDATTPLNRVVDFLEPESLIARALATASASQMQQYAAIWAGVAVQGWPQDLGPAAQALAEVGVLLAQYFVDDSGKQALEARLLDLYGPHGDYVVAAVPPILEWLRRA